MESFANSIFSSHVSLKVDAPEIEIEIGTSVAFIMVELRFHLHAYVWVSEWWFVGWMVEGYGWPGIIKRSNLFQHLLNHLFPGHGVRIKGKEIKFAAN